MVANALAMSASIRSRWRTAAIVLASKAVLRKSISLTRRQPVIAAGNPANNSREQSFVQT
jgi:hypothetical protein